MKQIDYIKPTAAPSEWEGRRVWCWRDDVANPHLQQPTLSTFRQKRFLSDPGVWIALADIPMPPRHEGTADMERLLNELPATPELITRSEWERIRLGLRKAITRVETLEEAVLPFATMAPYLADRHGWVGYEKDAAISRWFGPGDFAEAGRALASRD